jgi:drug/metabolite transporter (DMT)-like permease
VIWILWGLLGAFSVALINSFWRLNPWGLSFWWLLVSVVLPTTFGTQLGFLNFYQKAPNFLTAWFLGSALNALTGYAAAVFIFKESPNFLNGLGIGFILLGGFLLTK